MDHGSRTSVALVLLAALISGCSASPSSPGSPSTTASATAGASVTPAAPASPTATSAVGTPAPLAGFEDWSFVNGDGADLAGIPADFTLTLKHRLLWFMASRGFLMYRLTTGDFRATAHVIATKTSDPSLPAGGNGSVQLGGLMARNGGGVAQNYVHIVVGDDGDGSSIETKTTTNSVSLWTGPAWPSTEADLRICRIGTRFGLYQRFTTADPWVEAVEYDRPDLPASLQVGIDLYTNDEPDITLTVKDLLIEPVAAQADCTPG
jgi:hypothetical protein